MCNIVIIEGKLKTNPTVQEPLAERIDPMFMPHATEVLEVAPLSPLSIGLMSFGRQTRKNNSMM